MQLNGLVDLIRYIVSNSINKEPLPIFYQEKDGKHVFWVVRTITTRSVVLVWANHDSAPKHPIIRYKIEDGKELWEFCDDIKDLSWRYVPIIKVRESDFW